MSKRTGPLTTVRAATAHAVNDTYEQCATADFQMGAGANSILLYVTSAVASPGNVSFYLQHSPDNSTWFDFCTGGESPEVFGPIAFTGAAQTKSISIPGLPPNEYIRVWLAASANATSATTAVTALAYLDDAGTVSADVSVGDIEVNLEDVTNEHDAAVKTDGLQVLHEAKDIDGSALPNAVVEGDAVRPAASAEGVAYAAIVAEDGSTIMPTMDANTRPGFVTLTDGTSEVDVIATINSAKTDTSSVAGTATNVNGGNRDAGTQTVTLADDDPAVTSLGVIDNAIIVDDAAFTPATDSVMMAGATFDDTTPDSVDEGDAGALRMSANRNLYGTIRDAAGNERGANVDASNQLAVADADAITALQIMDDWDESDRAKVNPIAGQAGIAANAGAMDALTTRVTVATDDTHFGAVGAAADVDGVVHGQLRYIGEAVDGLEAAVHAEDDAHQTGDEGIQALTVRADTAAATSGTDGDYQPLVTDANGRLHATLSGVVAATPLQVQVGDGTTQAGVNNGASHDSLLVRITDGTNLCSISNTGELEVSGDAGAALATEATLATIDTDTGVIAGDTTSIDAKTGIPQSPGAGYFSFQDTSFVTGDSPQSHDINTALSRNALRGYIVCDGPNSISFTIDQGSGAGSAIVLENGETFSLDGLDVDTIAVTWSADSAYRVFAQ